MHIFVNGLSGKMGTSISHRANKAKNIFIIDSIKDCDAVIDFSRPESTMEIINQCKKHNKPIVIGTTGFNHEQLEEINNASQVDSNITLLQYEQGYFLFKRNNKRLPQKK